MFEDSHIPWIRSHPRKAVRRMTTFCVILAWITLPWLFWGTNRVVPNQIPLRHLQHRGDPIGFSADGRAFITRASDPQRITLWDVPTGKKLVDEKLVDEKLVEKNLADNEEFMEMGISAWPHSVAVSPDRAALVIRGDFPLLLRNTTTGIFRRIETPLVILDMTTGAVRQQLLGDNNCGFGVAYSPDGRTLAFGNRNGITLWNCSTSTHLFTYESPAYARQLVFSPDSKTLVVSDWLWKVGLIDVETGRQTGLEHPRAKRTSFWAGPVDPYMTPLAVSNEIGVLGEGGRSEVILWDTATGQHLCAHQIRGTLDFLAISSDGQVVAACQSMPNAISAKLREWNQFRWTSYFPDYHGAALLDATTGNELAWIPGPREAVFLPDSHTLAGFCPDDNSIRLWDVPPRRAVPPYVAWSATTLVTVLSGWLLRWRRK